MKKIILIVLIITLIPLINANMPIFVKPLDSGGNIQPNLPFSYIFKFTTDSGCSDVVLSNTAIITTDLTGMGFVDINYTNSSVFRTNVGSYYINFFINNTNLTNLHIHVKAVSDKTIFVILIYFYYKI